MSAAQSRRSSVEAGLARAGFHDSGRARSLLDRWQLRAHPDVVTVLAASADPAAALTGLDRLLEACGSEAVQLLQRLQRDAGLRQRLLTVLGASAALADFLARSPGSWRLLDDDSVVSVRPSAFGLRRLLLQAVGADPESRWPCAAGEHTAAAEPPLDRLRSAYRARLLVLAARDLTGTLAVEDVAGELADLAAAALDASLAIARAGLPADAPRVRLAVVALGKCGGRELNYASDVDVIFIAEPGEPGGATAEALRTATRLAEGLMRACGEVTPAGQLFPVDAGLRPEGRDGPLVRTLESHLAYYHRWARTWEYQALLKARPVAGDVGLGRAFTDALTPLVWEASARPDFVAEVQQMRRRVERSVPARRQAGELKLGPGGLRDVEFSVQLLQLVHGRGDPELRAADTLSALEALGRGGYVGREDANQLAAAYRWLRAVEHRVQLQRLVRTHTVPAEPGRRLSLARSLGYGDVAAFDAARTASALQVRQLHEKLFYRPLLNAVARLPTPVMRLTPEAARDQLAALGFADPPVAMRHLEALTSGLSRRAAIQRTLLPALLPVFAAACDPDAGLLAFRQVSEALGESPWYLRLLRDAGLTAERLAQVLASGRYVADLLGRAPEAMAILADDSELLPRPRSRLDAELAAICSRGGDAWEATVATARALRRLELVRVGCADLLGRLDVHAVGTSLSSVTAAAVQSALTVATAKIAVEGREALPMRLAVVALGHLGGGEQGYGSDADVVFVHEPLAGAEESRAAAAAHAVAEETRRLLALPAPDPPLSVDAGLRPEGRQGPLTRSVASYARYYRRWSALWEAQALVRAAPCAGDEEVTARFLAEVVDPVRYPATIPADALAQVRRLKARMEAERIPRGLAARHLKLGPGGLADVEWVAQLLTLRHGAEIPALRVTGTIPALRAAAHAGLLDSADAEVLIRTWTVCMGLRNAATLVTGRPGDLLPAGGRELAGTVALALRETGPAPDVGAAVESVRRLRARARDISQRVLSAGTIVDG